MMSERWQARIQIALGNLVIFLIAIFFATRLDLTISAGDVFHEGEWGGTLPSVKAFWEGKGLFPLLIHGGLDYLPNALAVHLYGSECSIVGVRIINHFILAISWYLFFLLCILVSRRISGRWIFAIIPILTQILLSFDYTGLGRWHQAMVGPRDLVLIAVLLLAYLEIDCTKKWPYHLSMGFLAGLSVFWLYDRTIFLFGFLSVLYIGLVLRRRMHEMLLFLFTAVATACSMGFWGRLGTFREIIHQILYLKRSSYIWNLIDVDHYAIVSTLLFLTAAWGGMLLLYRKCYGTRNDTFFWGGLCLLQCIMVKPLLNRPDSTHLHMLTWPALLAAMAVIAEISASTFLSSPPLKNTTLRLRSTQAQVIILLVLALTYFGAYRSNIGPRKKLATLTNFIKLARSPLRNEIVLDPNLLAAVNGLKSVETNCIFSWSNSGLISGVSGIRACAGITYPIYVAPFYEDEYLDNLKKDEPNAILYSMEQGSFSFEHSMPVRLPKVSAWIAQNFVQDTAYGEWILLRRKH